MSKLDTNKKTEAGNRVRNTFSLPKKTHDDFTEICKENGRVKAWVFEQIVVSYIKQCKRAKTIKNNIELDKDLMEIV